MNEHRRQHTELQAAVTDLEDAIATYDDAKCHPRWGVTPPQGKPHWAAPGLADMVAEITRNARHVVHQADRYTGRPTGIGPAIDELATALADYDCITDGRNGRISDGRIILTRIARVMQGARRVVAVAKGQGRGTMDRASAVRVGM